MSVDATDSAARRCSRTILVTLLIIIAAGAGLRLYGLEIQSLSNDELSSWRRSNYQTFTEVLEHGVREDVHPPGHHLVMFAVIRLLGDDETTLRLTSVIPGILAIGAIFLLGRRMISCEVGLIAAAMLATLCVPIDHAQTARMYALLMLLSIVTTHLWWHLTCAAAERARPGIPWLVGFVISAAALAYVHYFGTLLAGGFCASLGVQWITTRRAHWWLPLMGVLVVLCMLPWLPGLRGQLQHPPSHLQSPGPLFFGEYVYWVSNQSLLIASIVVLGVCAALVRSRAHRNVVLVLCVIAIGPYALMHAKSIVSAPVLKWRFLIVSAPALWLLVAYGMTQVPLVRRHASVAALLIAASLTAHLTIGRSYFSEPSRPQFREASQVIMDHPQTTGETVIVACAWGPQRFEYYLRHNMPPLTVDLIACDHSDIDAIASLMQERAATTFWFVQGHRHLDAALMDALGAQFTERERTNLHDAMAVRYDVPGRR